MDASTEHSSFYDAEQTIDGSGLPDPFTPASAHDAYAAGNHWTTKDGDTLEAFVTRGFDTAYTLDRVYIWNHQSNGGIEADPGYDVTLIDLTLLDASSSVLLFMDDVALAPDTATGQTILFTGGAAAASGRPCWQARTRPRA